MMRRWGFLPIAAMVFAVAQAICPPALAQGTPGTTQQQPARPAPPQLQGDPTSYYQRPFDIPQFLLSWEKAGRPGTEAVAGFLSEVFSKDARAIRTVVEARLDQQTQRVVIVGLVFAGKVAEAKDAFQKWGWSLEQNQKILEVTPLLRQKIHSPNQFDMLWGASFATADPAYVRPIYDYLEATAATPGIDLADIVQVIVLRARLNKEAMEAIAKKYPRETFMRVVTASSALWSLESNARQHKFVAAALDAFAKEKPGSLAAKGISDLRAQIARR